MLLVLLLRELVPPTAYQVQILILRTVRLQERFLLVPLPLVYTVHGTIAATQDTAGAAFSFSQSYTQADAVPTSAATLGANPNFGSLTTYAAGTKDTLAGTVTSAGVLTVTAGGAGTSAIGQFVSEITVID